MRERERSVCALAYSTADEFNYGLMRVPTLWLEGLGLGAQNCTDLLQPHQAKARHS